MPKKTRIQKLRNQIKINDSPTGVQAINLQNDFFAVDPLFKKDLLKSILFAVCITGFEIALYFVYYLRVFERR